MAVTAAQVSVGTTAVELSGTGADTVSGQSLVIKNKGTTASVFLGGSNAVTTGSGFQVEVDSSVAVDLGPGEQLWGIAASAQTVHVLRAGV